MTGSDAFTDPTVTKALYQEPQRLARRTGSLMAAKVRGPDAAATIAELAVEATSDPRPTVLDIGCGRGSTTSALARRLTKIGLAALDQSPALLAATRHRLDGVNAVCADFHKLPLATASIHIAVAAFCLYHSAQPDRAVSEIARCLTSGGHAILVTKSADSYAEIDQLISASQLDQHAGSRPSLYESFNTTSAAQITATAALRVERTVHHKHAFVFPDFDHLAAYVSTSPKYQLPTHLIANAAVLADELRRRLPERPILATSTVTYVVAVKL